MAPVASNWTGYYVGLDAGYGWDKAPINDVFGDPLKNVAPDLSSRGFVGGAHAGYNQQAGSIVYGIEGDLSAAPWSKDGLASPSGSGKKTASSHMTGLASIRGRLGVVFDNALFYGTGGYGVIKSTYYNSNFTSSNPSHGAPVVGGGVEYKVSPRLTVGVENLWYLTSATDTMQSFSPGGALKKVIAFGTGNVGVVRGRVSWNW
jgi:outer membrane immunogenic protein